MEIMNNGCGQNVEGNCNFQDNGLEHVGTMETFKEFINPKNIEFEKSKCKRPRVFESWKM